MRSHGRPEQKSILSPWPTGRQTDWLQRVNAVVTPKERDAWRLSLERSRPFGDDAWTMKLASQLGFEHTIRPGRPSETGESRCGSEVITAARFILPLLFP